MRFTDDLYPAVIARCQHININGTQCGSPALKRHKFCYFHDHWYSDRDKVGPRPMFAFELPVLEDAASVQTALMQVLRLMLNNQIDTKKAALLLYGLQTAAGNVDRAEFEPEPVEVVIDRHRIRHTALGDAAWYKEEFTSENESDDESEDESDDEAGVDLSQAKLPARIADWTAEQAMDGLQQAMTIINGTK